MDAKTCTCCKRKKPSEAFHVNRHHKDGLASQCKVCILVKKSARLAGDKDARDRNRKYGRAYDRALFALRDKFPVEFAELLAVAKRAEGIT